MDDGLLHNPTVTSNFLKGLSKVTNLSLPSNGITTIEEDALCELPLLTQLDLVRNNITLTSHVFDCSHELLLLDLATTGLTELPEGVFDQLKKLRVLQLWGNRLKTLKPGVFHALGRLASLELSNNQLESLPAGVFDGLVSLVQLNLGNNKIKTVPPHLFSATVQLQKVRWDANEGLVLHEDTFSNLTKLETVTLSGNGLGSVPERLFLNSTNIQTVNLAKNRLTAIPEKLFYGLEKLKTLDLSHNQLEEIKNTTFNSLKALESLFLQNNKLREISKNLFYYLYELVVLRLDYNEISTLPMFVDQKKLKIFNASHNRISYESNSLGLTPLNQCVELEEVDLSHNQLTDFSDDFENVLSKLRLVDLSFNRITSMEVYRFQRMDSDERRINLSNNSITVVNFSLAEPFAQLQDNDMFSSNLYSTVVSISNNPIACDCTNYDLSRYYHDLLDPRVLTMITILKEDVRCANSDLLVAELPPEAFTCDLKQKDRNFPCPRNCSCEWRPYEEGIALDCANGGLEAVPQLEFSEYMVGLRQLEVDLRGNRLKSGPKKEDSGYERVTRLLLSHNEIERVDWIPPKLEVSLFRCLVAFRLILCCVGPDFE